MKRISLGIGAFVVIAGIGSVAEGRNASIPFVNHGGIRDWTAPNNRTLYVQARNRQWFKAKLNAPCQGLDFTNTIRFDTGASNSFDRFSSVVVRGRRCRVSSLERVDGPSRGTKHHPMPEPKKEG